MVQSKLDKTINYIETKKLEQEDKDYDADLFEMTFYGEDRIIALGQVKFTYVDKNVVYYPVYIIKDDRVDSQIGVYEILSDQQPSVLDEDGDIDIDKLGDLHLYSFVTENYIKDETANTPSPFAEKEEKKGEEQEGDDDNEEEIDDDDEEEHEGTKGDDDEEEDIEEFGFSPLQKQNAAQAKKERDGFKRVQGLDWVARFFRNTNYKLVDNEGGGDCLFSVIRDGLKRVGVQTTVDRLRETLANEATEDVFQGYKNMFNMARGELNDADKLLKDLTKQHRDLKKRAKKTGITREEVTALINQANDVGKTHKRTKAEKKAAIELINEYAFMKGVNNLAQFKEKVKTCSFWGETWAISTLERVLNIKLVLFGLQAYKHKDMDNVLLCGQLNDTVLEKAGKFEPTHYILTEFMGWHYRLITYKSRGAFTFDELPFDIKRMIVEKCMEKQAGPYYIIPDFRTFMAEINVVPPALGDDGQPEEDDDDDEGELYDGETVFQFFSRSADDKPGKGRGEKLKAGDELRYAQLAAIPDWRKRLSNFWIESFELDSHTWSSVEHYYQASKFKENNPEFYLTFALDMNPEGQLALDAALAKGAGGKSGKFKGKRVRQKEVKLDPNFFSGRHKVEMKRAQEAKFTQNEELKSLLLLTGDAKLNHFARGQPPIVFKELMEIRRNLEREKKK